MPGNTRRSRTPSVSPVGSPRADQLARADTPRVDHIDELKLHISPKRLHTRLNGPPSNPNQAIYNRVIVQKITGPTSKIMFTETANTDDIILTNNNAAYYLSTGKNSNEWILHVFGSFIRNRETKIKRYKPVKLLSAIDIIGLVKPTDREYAYWSKFIHQMHMEKYFSSNDRIKNYYRSQMDEYRTNASGGKPKIRKTKKRLLFKKKP